MRRWKSMTWMRSSPSHQIRRPKKFMLYSSASGDSLGDRAAHHDLQQEEQQQGKEPAEAAEESPAKGGCLVQVQRVASIVGKQDIPRPSAPSPGETPSRGPASTVGRWDI